MPGEDCRVPRERDTIQDANSFCRTAASAACANLFSAFQKSLQLRHGFDILCGDPLVRRQLAPDPVVHF